MEYMSSGTRKCGQIKQQETPASNLATAG